MLANGTVRRLRERAGVSRRTMAATLGVTPNIYGEWEAGKTAPRDANALKLLTVVEALESA